MRIHPFLAVASLLVLGCSEPTSAATARALRGTWDMRETIPGNGFEMTLDADGDSLSGTGQFVFEAGVGGTSTIEGAVASNVVTLDFTIRTAYPGSIVTSTAHFTGHLVLGRLQGTIKYDGPDTVPISTTFVRRQLQ